MAWTRLAKPFRSGARIDPVYGGAVGVLGVQGTSDAFDNNSGHQFINSKQLAAEKHWIAKTGEEHRGVCGAAKAPPPRAALDPDDYTTAMMANGFNDPSVPLPHYLDEGNGWRLDVWRTLQASYKQDRAARDDYDANLANGGWHRRSPSARGGADGSGVGTLSRGGGWASSRISASRGSRSSRSSRNSRSSSSSSSTLVQSRGSGGSSRSNTCARDSIRSSRSGGSGSSSGR